MTPHDCPLCRRLGAPDGLPETEVVWRFPHSVALLGEWQFYRGHCLLVSRRHATELSALADAERQAYLDEMCLLARAAEIAFHPHKLNYELLGNQVPHLHWHLFPRYAEDPDVRRPVWIALERAERDPQERRRLEGDPAARPDVAAALTQSLTTLGAPVA
jgi:diadenosine tetraphosphate (Ap4A) HIT family hydrolase